MTDYSKTKIYKIESHLGDKIYVGSTAKHYLSQRFQQHKNDYKKWKQTNVKKITSFDVFDLYGIDNCKIVLIEDYPCTSKDQKNAKEGHYIKELNCVNKVIPGRTKKEYYEDNKKQIKEYYEDNKKQIIEYQKEYRQDNKDIIAERKKEYRQDNKEKIKEYKQDNKDKIKEYQKEYRQKKKAAKVEIDIYQENASYDEYGPEQKQEIKLELEKQPEQSEPLIN